MVCIESIDCYPMEEVEEKLSELKEKVERGIYEYNNDHYYIDYSYLSDNTKFFLKKLLHIEVKGNAQGTKRQ
jgi:hypothetical protein